MVFEVPYHWHKHQDEYWTVTEGRMVAKIDGKSFVMEAGLDTVHIARCHAQSVKAIKGEKAALSESSTPGGRIEQA